MNNWINGKINHFVSEIQHPLALRLFGKLVYGWFLLHALFTYSERDFIWGEKTVLLRYGAGDNALNNLMHLLMYELSFFLPVYYVHLFSALLSMTDRQWSFIPRSITWISGLMIYFAGRSALHPGMLLMLLLAFYCIPAYTRSYNPYRVVLTNFSYISSFIQIVLMYVFSVLFKLTGRQWLTGDAVYYILNLDAYTSAWIQQQDILKNDLFMKFLNYTTLAYQLAFPLVIWTKKRSILLWIGVFFYLLICAVMHLWDVGLAIVFSYSLFLSEEQIKRVAATFGFQVTS